MAQFAVDPGEAVAATPLAVLSAPVAGAPQVMEIEAGRTVTVLGYPRGTGMAWIAIGGRELGYVSAASLAPIDRERPVLYTAVVVPDVLAAGTGVLPGDHWLAGGAGRIVGIADVGGDRIILDGGDRNGVPPGDLRPIIGTYSPTTLGPGSPGFFAARFGSFSSLAEAEMLWREIQDTLPELSGLPPYIFRRATTRGIAVELAAGPFSRSRVEEVCTMLARRSRDCWVIAVEIR
jgi:hypothetical protein